MKAYGRQDLIGRHIENQRFFDVADGIAMGHGRRSSNAIRKLQKKSARSTIKRETNLSIYAEFKNAALAKSIEQ